MKKLLLILAIVLFANVAKAEGFGIHIGPKVGYQTAALSLDKADIKTGFDEHLTIGAFGRFTIKNFIIQPELLWFKSGQVYKFEVDNFSPKVEFNQQNLAMPIFLGYQFFDFKFFKLRGNVGPVMYFVLDQSKKKNGDVEEVDAKANNMTWGGAVNVGIDVLWFTLDVNYSFALTDIIDKGSVKIGNGSYVLDSTKQNMFTVTLGFKLISLGL
ncbi:MAG: PorT family protein [Bacteroidales bacterium]|nr:PorT family protein [Bacteroidales bacterium]